MTRRRAARALLAASALALWAGCGSEERAARAADGRVAVALDDYAFDPQVISARPGRVTFALSNRGRVAHSFRLQRGGRPVAQVPSLLPGERETATVTLKRGNYRIFCALANHEELGMYGSLSIR